MPQMFTERLTPEDTKNNIIYNEHLIRYELAKQFANGKKVLDIATGSGYGAKILAEAGASEVIAADIDKETLSQAAKNYFHQNVKYLNCGAEEIILEDKTIDLAVSLETIEHLPNQDLFLTELRRVLKDDGLAIISTPNKEVSKNKNPFHIKELNREEFLEILSKYFDKVYLLEQTNGIATV
ncbi:MAG: class I SAM-dependent methyltransferase, partial [Patescibacteria group bacterium]